jgi:hypothetical protein
MKPAILLIAALLTANVANGAEILSRSAERTAQCAYLERELAYWRDMASTMKTPLNKDWAESKAKAIEARLFSECYGNRY